MILAICCKIKGVSTINLFLIIVNVNIWRGKGHYYYYNRPTEWIRQQHWGWWQDLSSPVVGCVAILLQEVVLNELGDLQSDFIGLSEGSLGNTHKWIEFKAFAPKHLSSELNQILNMLCPLVCKAEFTPCHEETLVWNSPFLRAAQSQPGPPPPAESLWPLCAEEQTLGNVCRSTRPKPLCICCS